jgi:DNA modification methylase
MKWPDDYIPNGFTPYHIEDAGIIFNCDCRDILPHLPKVDLVLTDPPYGINHSSSHGASWENTTINGDEDTKLRDYVINLYDGFPMVVFGTWKQKRPSGLRTVLVWDKGPAFGMGDLKFPWKNSWEEIYVFGNGWDGYRDEGVLKGHLVVSWESKGRTHPHEKPVSLITHFIKKSPQSDIILDPFLGSGTTAVAAKELGRKFLGIEISEEYCRIAVKRLRQGVLSFGGNQ